MTDESARRVDRRTMLAATAGLAASSGCVSIGSSGAKYELFQEESMLLTPADLPGDGWVRKPSGINYDVDRAYLAEERQIAVLVDVNVQRTVSDAKDDYDQVVSGVRDRENADLAAEAVTYRQGDFAVVTFRDGNAVGSVGAARVQGETDQPDPSRAREYSTMMYEKWQEL